MIDLKKWNDSVSKTGLSIIPGILFFAALFMYSLNASAQHLKSIPTKDQVGAAMLPDTIAPVDAPFVMAPFEKPEFPALTVNITEKGAKENKPVTKIIQKAIDAVHKQGGGTVIIPSGSWQAGRIVLKSNVNLHLEEGAVLHFSNDVDDYLPVVFSRSAGVEGMSLGGCIYANGQHNIAITGKGQLIGPRA